MTKYWIKLYHEILHDPKMGRMGDHLWRKTIELFLVAGEYDQGGALPPLSEISWTLRTTEEMLETDLIELQKLGILTLQEGRWVVTKFLERQEPMEKSEYMRRKRLESHKNEYYPLPDSYHSVTNSNTDTDTDTDTESIAADAAPPPPVTPKKRTPQPERHPERRDLIAYFLDKTKIKFPKTSSQAEIKAAQKFWWGPADRILEISNKDPAVYRPLIDGAISEMDRDHLTISSLNSVLSIVTSIHGRSQRHTGGNNGYTAA
jgi:hypothetical protein